MKILSLLLALTFSFSALANSVGKIAFENAMDEYHYAIAVDWDQKDQEFYDKATTEFHQEISKIYKSGELSRNDLLTILSDRIKDKKLRDSLILKFSLLENASSAEEVTKLIKDFSKTMYSQGASWNGEAILSITVYSVIFGGLIFLFAMAAANEGKTCSGTVVWQNHTGIPCDPNTAIDNCFDYCYEN